MRLKQVFLDVNEEDAILTNMKPDFQLEVREFVMAIVRCADIMATSAVLNEKEEGDDHENRYVYRLFITVLIGCVALMWRRITAAAI